MSQKYTGAQKTKLVERYQSGVPVATICSENSIAPSTFYSWVKPYSVTVTKAGEKVNLRDFDALKKHNEKLEAIISVLKSADCTASSPLQDKLIAMEPLHGQFSVHVLCEALNVPRGTFYNHIFRRKGDDSMYVKRRNELREPIQRAYDESNQVLGPDKVRAVLAEQGYTVSKKLIAELMKEMGLYSVRTTAKKDYKSLKRKGKQENLVKRCFHTEAPNQTWVSDVTVFRLNNRYYYICIIIDLFSRKIVSYKISLSNSTKLITATFKAAYALRNPDDTLVFHSDRGIQYCAYAFRKLLHDCNVEQSFSNPGTPHDNAVAESFFATLKKEELYRTDYRSDAEFRRRIDEYIAYYNGKRPHAALNYKTPEWVEEAYVNKK